MNSPTNSTAFSLKTLQIIPHLSPRERVTAELLLQAKRNKEIAQEMNIETRTVKAYLYRLFAKMGLTNTWNRHTGDGRIKLAIRLHEHRAALGVRCQACGEI
jgi:DNA-binding NarL/FixJ family response regulator